MFASPVTAGRMAHDLAHGVVCLELVRIEKRAVRIGIGFDGAQIAIAG